MTKFLLKYILLFILFLSCNKSKKELDEIKLIGNDVLFESKKDSISGNTQYYNYFSKDKNPIIEYLQLSNIDSVFHYRFTIKNNEGRILCQIEVKNGKILKEYSYNSEKLNSDLGSFYYKNYCYHCHHWNKQSISKSILMLKKINKIDFTQRYLENNHVLQFSEKELELIHNFINDLTY